MLTGKWLLSSSFFLKFPTEADKQSYLSKDFWVVFVKNSFLSISTFSLTTWGIKLWDTMICMLESESVKYLFV